ncbi:MAG TPA: DoxX family membrane protein [Candidatus Acidoferrum sp.]|jgi:uncharacterized membrane protein YphA (DoxX/SURF4 family)|nr:DoxX family membrane protein [Candidatus Acidoferrum sp.]
MELQSTANANEPASREKKGFARHLPAVARILLGLVFFVFGLNGFLHFIPEPKTPMSEGAMAFAGGLMKTGYMFPLIMGTQLLVGVLLLLNRFVPLALALIAPVIVNIIAFHIFLQPAGIAPGAVALVLELYLAWAYRKSFCPMLVMRAKPD